MLAQATGRIAADTGHDCGRLLSLGEVPFGTHDEWLLQENNLLGTYVLRDYQVTSQLIILLFAERFAFQLVLGPVLLLVAATAISNKLAAGAGECGCHAANGTIRAQHPPPSGNNSSHVQCELILLRRSSS